jgi:hypothetical protein
VKSFKEFLNEERERKDASDQIRQKLLFEARTYKQIPGKEASYREDPANTNTHVDKHVHVYAKSNGKGTELYSVDMKGKGHDGNSGKTIPKKHADFFRGQGYKIPDNNILESLTWDELLDPDASLTILEDCDDE